MNIESFPLERSVLSRMLAGLWVATLMVLVGCSTQWFVEDFEAPDARVGARATYCWQGGLLLSEDPIDFTTAWATTVRIQDVVVEVLAEKGYRQVESPDDADMIVSFKANVGLLAAHRENRAIHATAAPWPGDVESSFASNPPLDTLTSQYNVLIAIDEPASRRLIWRGSVDEEVRVASSQHALSQVLEMVRDIARRIPDHRSDDHGR
jgi:hypothetical protein